MNSKRSILLCLLLALVTGFTASAQEIRDIDITLSLLDNGGVVVHEAWDINTGTDITEWYLVRENLGDITIPSLYVSEGGKEFEDVGEWDIHKSLAEKAGKCGIVHKSNGVELCWGIGSYGDHVFHPVYGMVRAVKSLNDYDMLHLQVVSPGLSSPPKHVKVTVQSDDFQLDTLNTRLWAFGYVGNANVVDGKAVFESSEQLDTEDSVIILLRFEKGLMHPKSVQERDFQEALDKALADSDYLQQQEEDDKMADGIAGFFTTLIFFLIGRRIWKVMFPSKYSKFKGLKSKDIGWYRDIPLDGKLEVADKILEDTYLSSSKRNLPMAMILRMIYKGYLDVTRDLEGPAKISFKAEQDEVKEDMGLTYSILYGMMKQAAGKNGLLEEKEFSTWMRAHDSDAYSWTTTVENDAKAYLFSHLYMNKHNVLVYTKEGTEAAKQVLGLKKFLEDFTLSKEREAVDVKLWKEYLVYAGLFCIADKVAKQLKDIDPELFRQQIPCDTDNLATTMSLLNSLSHSIASSSTSYYNRTHVISSSGSSYSRSSGGGGSSSRGGGGGYSGGGRGGGGR